MHGPCQARPINWIEAVGALLGKDLRDQLIAAAEANRESSGTRVMGDNQRLFDELLVHTRHSCA
jgi:hypothetical protein